jgi:signal transduction histidine kinase
VIAIENVRLFKELEARNRDLTESLEQQTATSEILQVISGSPTDVQPVLEIVAQNAARLCGASDAIIRRVEGNAMLPAAHFGSIPMSSASVARPITRASIAGRAILERKTIHLSNLPNPEFVREYPEGAVVQQREGYRTIVVTPLLREGAAIGMIAIRRMDARPFTDKQITLLRTFADQAVIAIENVRLFTELQARNNDLTEALDQQTATSEILRVIASSPTDVQPVFDTIAERAMRLCDADQGWVFSFDGELIHVSSSANASEVGTDAVRQAFPVAPSRGMVTGRVILTGDIVHILDAREDPEYSLKALAVTLSYRGILGVPMLHRGRPIGVISVARAAAGPFSERQIELLKTFADQAVIAIENVRLFSELQEKNRALTAAHAQLTEALDQQTATSEILRVIASSPAEVLPVFEAITDSAMRLFSAWAAAVFRYEGQLISMAAARGGLPGSAAAVMAHLQVPHAPTEERPEGRAALTRTIQHVVDVDNDMSWGPRYREDARARGFRSYVAVPMLQGDVVVGVITVSRQPVGGFAPGEISLLQTFADQAVIAIENVRLFTELQEKNRALMQAHAQVTESLEQQTATSEILRVISSSPTDVQPVLDAVTTTAARVCGATDALIMRVEGQGLHRVAHFGPIPLVLPTVRPLTARSASGRAIVEGRTIHIHDILATDAARDYPDALPADAGAQWRTMLAVPLVREGAAIGAILIRRTEIRPFTAKEIQLLETFASQAVIAIENVRLFKELEARNRDLTEALEQQTATGDILRVISQSQTDVQPVFDTIIRNSVRLCGASHGGVYRFDGELVHSVAHDGYSPEQLEQWRATWPKPVTASSVACIAVRTRSPFRVSDFETDPMRLMLSSETRENLRARGSRSVMAVPMLRHGDVIGVISLAHRDADAFSDTHVELLKTFADQAVIAIENVRLFKELENANRELTAASQHKSEFLANMSHELRTPLNAIIGFSELLSERLFGDLNEKQEEYLKDIHASGQHLLSLINDILDLSKIEAGRMELELTDFDLPTAIDNALTLVRERAGRRGIALHQVADEGLGQIRGDERKIKQVLLNLLSNAIKFTPEGGRIEVRAKPVNESMEVSVTDTGVGIAPEDQEAIFEEFRQVGIADKKVEGTGLGLALSRRFVELHGGRIWVKSQVGLGSTFTFTIPVRRGR